MKRQDRVINADSECICLMARVVRFGKKSQGDLGSQGGLVKEDGSWMI